MRIKLYIASLWYCIQLVAIIDLLPCTGVSAVQPRTHDQLWDLGRNINEKDGMAKRFLRIEGRIPQSLETALERLKASKFSREIMKYYLKLRLKYWEMMKTPLVNVFEKLHLDKQDPENFFMNPKFDAWVSLVNKKEGKGSNQFIYSTLIQNGKYSEKDMAYYLEIGLEMTKTETKNLAKGLQIAQREAWSDSGKTPKELFEDLHLKGPYFYDRPLAQQWLHYYRNKYEPKDVEADITSLILNANTEKDVAYMSVHYKQKNLWNAQVKKWEDSKISPDTLFEHLDLEKVELQNLLNSPLFITWFSFAQSFAKENNFSLKAFLNHKYEPDPFEQMLHRAKTSDETDVFAEYILKKFYSS